MVTSTKTNTPKLTDYRMGFNRYQVPMRVWLDNSSNWRQKHNAKYLGPKNINHQIYAIIKVGVF